MSPPGETLLDILREHGWTQRIFAEMIGRPAKTVNELIKGKIIIIPSTALDLERVTGVDARFWLYRDADYQLYKFKRSRKVESL